MHNMLFFLCLILIVFTQTAHPAKPDHAVYRPVQLLRNSVADALNELLPEDICFDPTDSEQWTELLDMALHAQDVETLAELSPYVHDVYEYTRSVAVLTPVADWLLPRLDYFELAVAAVDQVRERPVQTHTPPHRASSPRHARHTPPPQHYPLHQSRPAPTAATVKKRRAMAVRNPENWRQKMSNRKVPNQAASILPYLKNIFQQEGIPPELVWMAEVESSFNPLARSPAGAMGLFQLMPPTAQHYGLSVENPDERCDPMRNAGAAARYLRDLHNQFGSWSLALAAYNAGPTRIKKAMQQKGGQTFEEIADTLPMETRMYVPKVLALINIRENLDAMRLPPPRLPAFKVESDKRI